MSTLGPYREPLERVRDAYAELAEIRRAPAKTKKAVVRRLLSVADTTLHPSLWSEDMQQFALDIAEDVVDGARPLARLTSPSFGGVIVLALGLAGKLLGDTNVSPSAVAVATLLFLTVVVGLGVTAGRSDGHVERAKRLQDMVREATPAHREIAIRMQHVAPMLAGMESLVGNLTQSNLETTALVRDLAGSLGDKISPELRSQLIELLSNSDAQMRDAQQYATGQPLAVTARIAHLVEEKEEVDVTAPAKFAAERDVDLGDQ